ncbi:hypothetical protein HDU82_008465 [Entophlyctis luteolus]|nr:hypothetical protein HDU82_008465 [Entophlyctis luteolus]
MQGSLRISLADKKVYNITHLKRFCSRQCMAASDFLAKQIPPDPGYLRKPDAMLSIEIVDLKVLNAIRTESLSASKAFLSTAPGAASASEPSATALYVRHLVAQTPKPPAQPADSKSTIDPSALAIRERDAVPPPPPPSLLTESIENDEHVRAAAAETIEGFRIASAVARRTHVPNPAETPADARPPTTDVLPEYAERRKKAQKTPATDSPDAQSGFKPKKNNSKKKKSVRFAPEVKESDGERTSNTVFRSDTVMERETETDPWRLIPSASVFASASAGMNVESQLQSQLAAVRLSATSNTSTIHQSSHPTNVSPAIAGDDDSDDDSNAAWPLPSKKSIAKVAAAREGLSVFGRMWNMMMGMITRETEVFVKRGPKNVDMLALYRNLLADGIDVDALHARGKIFSEKIVKCATGICRRHAVKIPLQKDLVAFLETLYIRESNAILRPVEERILSIVFLKVVADTLGGEADVEDAGQRQTGQAAREDLQRTVLVEAAIRAESAGELGQAEISALVRGVFVFA